LPTIGALPVTAQTRAIARSIRWTPAGVASVGRSQSQ
jgi:hypothetical protein